MNSQEQILQAAVDWNIRQRDVAKKLNRTREVRRLQRNIDQLNEQLRKYSEAAN
jgi:hypothetical protein